MTLLAAARRRFGALLHACGLAAGAVTFLMMVLVVANALLRFLFNRPISGTLEITESALPLLVFLSLALTQYRGGHIRVVLVVRRLSPGARRAATCAAMVLGALFFAWCAWATGGLAMKSLAMNEQEWGSIRFPIYPVKLVVSGGLALLAVQFALDAAAAALDPGFADDEGAPG